MHSASGAASGIGRAVALLLAERAHQFPDGFLVCAIEGGKDDIRQRVALPDLGADTRRGSIYRPRRHIMSRWMSGPAPWMSTPAARSRSANAGVDIHGAGPDIHRDIMCLRGRYMDPRRVDEPVYPFKRRDPGALPFDGCRLCHPRLRRRGSRREIDALVQARGRRLDRSQRRRRWQSAWSVNSCILHAWIRDLEHLDSDAGRAVCAEIRERYPLTDVVFATLDCADEESAQTARPASESRSVRARRAPRSASKRATARPIPEAAPAAPAPAAATSAPPLAPFAGAAIVVTSVAPSL
jgi:hypothetical protein